MSDRYLSVVVEEAEQIATHHEQIAHSTENAAHEYLRYAVVNYPTLLARADALASLRVGLVRGLGL